MSKILLLIPALNAGGAERVMVTLANEWSKDNDVTLMVFNDGTCFYSLSDKVNVKPMNLMPAGSGVHRILSIPSIEIKRFKRIKEEILTGNYDFTLSFCYTTNLMASLVASKHKEKKIYVSERNDPYGYSSMLTLAINSLYRRCTIVICQNKMVKEYFTNQGFNNELIVLSNPVNFDDIPDERPDIPERAIITVGRLIDQKNQKLLIEAFGRIQDKYSDYIVRIYGQGPLENELKEQIKKAGLSERVILMGTVKRVMYEVNKGSIFVLPSNFEGFPNVLIEAMATGMPVISSDFKTGVAKELISNGKNGYLFEVGNVEQLAEAMEKMILREAEYKEIGQQNKAIATEYEQSVIAQKWMTALVNWVE